MTPQLRANLRSQFKRYRHLKAFLTKIKNKPCADCQGWFEPFQMDFDHRDPATKIKSVSQMVSSSREDLYKEIAKCDVVCANCHKLRTHKHRQLGLIKSNKRHYNVYSSITV